METTTTLFRKIGLLALGLLILVLSVYLLREFAAVLKPLFIAIFILYMIRPIREWLMKRGISGKLAYFVIVSLFLIGTLVVAELLYSSYTKLANDQKMLESYKLHFDGLKNSIFQWAGQAVPTQEMLDEWTGSKDFPKYLMSLIQRVVGSFVQFMGSFFIVVLYLVFLIAESGTWPGRVKRAFGEAHAARLAQVGESIHDGVSGYIAVKTWIGLATALITWLVLVFMGVDFSLIAAVLAFLLNFIPYLGSLAATLFPITVALLQFESPWTALILLIILVLLQVLAGQILEPKLAGKRLNLSPILLLLSLAFWGTIWGIVGMLLAVPLTVVGKIIFDNINGMKPLGALMSAE